MKDPLGKVGGRKFVFGLLIVILGFVLVVSKLAAAQEWITLVEITGGMYVLGNVGSKVVNSKII